MNESFLVTGALAAFGGLSHAYLGERMILIPLRRQVDLPATRLASTMRVLRFTWHFFSVVMVSLAVVFLALGCCRGGDTSRGSSAWGPRSPRGSERYEARSMLDREGARNRRSYLMRRRRIR